MKKIAGIISVALIVSSIIFFAYENIAGRVVSENEISSEDISENDISRISNKRREWSFIDEVTDERELELHRLNAEFEKNDGKNNVKNLYMTFNCGYDNGITSKILDVLKEKKVNAVFFITKQFAEREHGLVKRMIDEGHIIGNHSTSHPANGMCGISIDKQKEQIMVLHDYMKEHYEYTMKLFRFPSGTYSDQSLAVVSMLGYRSVFWGFAYADWDPDNQMDPEVAQKKLCKNIKPGCIYMFHAVSETNRKILGNFIDTARQQGYIFKEYY